jgi:hypothetical protein
VDCFERVFCFSTPMKKPPNEKFVVIMITTNFSLSTANLKVQLFFLIKRFKSTTITTTNKTTTKQRRYNDRMCFNLWNTITPLLSESNESVYVDEWLNKS